MAIRSQLRKLKLNKIYGNMKTNIARVAQHLRTSQYPPEEAHFRITDMIRATVVLDYVDQLEDAYK